MPLGESAPVEQPRNEPPDSQRTTELTQFGPPRVRTSPSTFVGSAASQCTCATTLHALNYLARPCGSTSALLSNSKPQVADCLCCSL
ncbi:hypothetical protein BJV74DRAFT_821629 [Russula compacta]|nr:hypothetical protein BJV74DRAFT_821629 [Russula compacta]